MCSLHIGSGPGAPTYLIPTCEGRPDYHVGIIEMQTTLLACRYFFITAGSLPGAADSGGQEGQPPLLTKSRSGKTIFLPLDLADSAG